MKKRHMFPAFPFIIILLCSCSDVAFEKPQPVWVTKNEISIPANLRGYYVSGRDTLRITQKRIVDTKAKPDFDLTLSDSVQLKMYNHIYFLNVRDENKRNWQTVIAKAENNYILLYTLSFKDSTIENKVREITRIKDMKSSNGNETEYLINPTPDEFHKILDQNLFTLSTDTLWKVI